MRRIIPVLAGLLALGGCATPTPRIDFLGQPVEVAVARYGQPDTVLDMPDGRRQYQWRKPRTDFVGEQIIRETCRHTIYARWNEPANGWIMLSRKPARRCP
jgi:hypothetical protein